MDILKVRNEIQSEHLPGYGVYRIRIIELLTNEQFDSPSFIFNLRQLSTKIGSLSENELQNLASEVSKKLGGEIKEEGVLQSIHTLIDTLNDVSKINALIYGILQLIEHLKESSVILENPAGHNIVDNSSPILQESFPHLFGGES